MDMPTAGCWQFALSWADQQDEVFIRYYGAVNTSHTALEAGRGHMDPVHLPGPTTKLHNQLSTARSAPAATVLTPTASAGCSGLHDAHFVHPDNEGAPDRSAREAGAKLVCQGCPVLEQCREHALSVHEVYGVWGGCGERGRRSILPRRRRPAAPGQDPG